MIFRAAVEIVKSTEFITEKPYAERRVFLMYPEILF